MSKAWPEVTSTYGVPFKETGPYSEEKHVHCSFSQHQGMGEGGSCREGAPGDDNAQGKSLKTSLTLSIPHTGGQLLPDFSIPFQIFQTPSKLSRYPPTLLFLFQYKPS